MKSKTKVLLVQLGANGDCLFVTTIAKQIKEVDYPGCELTWMVGSKYRAILTNNEYVDQIIEIQLSESYNLSNARENISNTLKEIKAYEKYDEVFITDYYLKTRRNWFGTIRSSLFRQYNHPLKINLTPHLVLKTDEIDHVRAFANTHLLSKENGFNILFECAPLSGQSDMTVARALEIAQLLIQDNSKTKVILSSANKINSTNENIIDASSLTWRENAELIKYCHLLLGCSSGISWINTSDWTPSIPTIQTINPSYFNNMISCSMKLDFNYFKLPTDAIIEMHNANNLEIVEAVKLSMISFNDAKKKFDKEVPFIYSLTFLRELRGYYSITDLFLLLKKISKNWRQMEYIYLLNKPTWLQPAKWFKKLGN